MIAPRLRVDCLGLFCPVPIVRTAEAIRTLEEGEVLELLGDDPGIREDLPAWCRSTGHELQSMTEADGRITGRILKRARRR